MKKYDPYASIAPVFGDNHRDGKKVFLGTGYFVSPSPYFITAEHVVRDWKFEFGTSIRNPGSTSEYSLELVHADRGYDVAILKCAGYQSPSPLKFADLSDLHLNETVVTLEYSTTSAKNILNPATRLGNVTRHIFLEEIYGPMGKEMLELSFPALRGASGAPVLYNNTLEIIGMIVSNVEYHLLPQQIESVLSSNNDLLEERKYLLPLGLAVNVKHIKRILEETISNADKDEKK